jgi:hypothetical protein
MDPTVQDTPELQAALQPLHDVAVLHDPTHVGPVHWMLPLVEHTHCTDDELEEFVELDDDDELCNMHTFL